MEKNQRINRSKDKRSDEKRSKKNKDKGIIKKNILKSDRKQMFKYTSSLMKVQTNIFCIIILYLDRKNIGKLKLKKTKEKRS